MRAIKEGMPILKTWGGILAPERERGMARAMTDLASHDLIEADASVHLILCHRGSAQHVAGLHAMDHSIVRLLVPESAKEDELVAPWLERFQAGAELHRVTLAFRPPVLRMKSHPCEGD